MNLHMSTIAPHEAKRPLALALDVGTSSARAALYDSRGRQIENVESRTRYQMTVTQDGGVEIEADKLIGIICATIDECLLQAATHLSNLKADLRDAIRVVGYSNFWHAMLGVSRNGDAVTPLYNWSDTRSAPDARALRLRLGADWIHERCGVVPHASYYPAKIQWLRRTDPALASKVSRWVSIGEYLYSKIFGRMLCGVSMASGTGLFNPNKNDWDDEMLAAVGVGRDQLSPLAEERANGSEGFNEMRREFAERWPALRMANWLPAVGDGAASNIGSGCFTRSLIAINVGTSGAMRVCWPAERVNIPKGLWCYRANRRYALIGGALSNAGDVYAWCKRVLRLDDDDEVIESKLAAMKADDHGLAALPFFSGERSTGWHSEARATFTGLNLSADPIEILRASLEAVCYRFAAIYERLKAEAPGDTRIIASGGGILNLPAWTRMMADVIGVPVVASAVPEASSRGAAMLVMEAFGQIGGLRDLETPLGEVFEPNARDHELYLRGRARQESLYDLLIEQGKEKL